MYSTVLWPRLRGRRRWWCTTRSLVASRPGVGRGTSMRRQRAPGQERSVGASRRTVTRSDASGRVTPSEARGSSQANSAPPSGASPTESEPPIAVRELGRDREAEPGAAAALGEERPRTPPCASSSGTPGPESATSIRHAAAGRRRRDPDDAAGRRPAHGVLDQVRDDLQDPVAVAGHGADVGLPQLEVEVAGARRLAVGRLAAGQELVQVDLVVPEREPVGLELREVEQVADQPLQPRRLGGRSRRTPRPARRGSSTMPSASAATCPRIAVSGVRSSCETCIRNSRSCSRASCSCRRHVVEGPVQRADLVPAAAGRGGRRSCRPAIAEVAAASRRSGAVMRKPSSSASSSAAAPADQERRREALRPERLRAAPASQRAGEHDRAERRDVAVRGRAGSRASGTRR